MISIARPLIDQEEKNAVIKVLESGLLASGHETEAFEEAFAAYIGMPRGIACTSGTAALELALRSLGLGQGDKILTTAFSFIASANCVVYAGGLPRFCDIDSDSFLMTPETVRAALDRDKDIRAIIAVHLFGQPCDMEGIMAIAKERGLTVVEDCAQSHGALLGGKKAGSFADASCFSFYPTKNMTTSEGGMVLFKNEAPARRCRMLINHGMRERYRHEITGYNFRMTNIAAAIGNEQLKKLPAFNAARQKNAAFLSAGITNPLIDIPAVLPRREHVFNQYTVKVKERERFLRHLEKNEIGCGIFYPLTIPEQRCMSGIAQNISFPAADGVKNRVVSLPVHPGLSRGDLETIVRAVNDFI
ncbi:MAG: DegT/DnrJ/EryC1/StrS family aminotransferase [Oscillospiraceae bacterium]|jgi:perosamine synthetase|nr:DegT/DnrJ/EryC1/StrS family aminotransferase [Oscillospiraceae bacterium]